MKVGGMNIGVIHTVPSWDSQLHALEGQISNFYESNFQLDQNEFKNSHNYLVHSYSRHGQKVIVTYNAHFQKKNNEFLSNDHIHFSKNPTNDVK